ncbi:hypothetical protein O3P69_004234 [Scylla paramamosain]|uniref:Uncharacterized protein n=2 Tax=Scylla TaxID=6760 RepID=A0AAW0UFN9_SCYPA
MEAFLKTCLASASYLLSGSAPLDGAPPAGAAESGGQKPRHAVRAAASTLASTQPFITASHCKGHTCAEDVPLTPFSTPCATPCSTPLPATEASSPGGRWLRPLGYAERFMTLSHDYGCMTTVYCLWLESRVPLDFDTVKLATVLMYRKMPNLRLYLDYRDGDYWWREMTREVVDVEEISTDDVETTVQRLVRRRYRMFEGPLWFTRFATVGGGDDLERDSNHNVKYKYVSIFGFHHNVSDGSTNMRFCQVFLNVLNDLAAGRTVDLRQEGIFPAPLQDRLGEQAGSRLFYLGIFLRRLYTIVLTFGLPVWNFITVYRMPRQLEAATHLLQLELDEFTTRKLLLRCKMEGVTLNSTFTAAANLALYVMVTAKNPHIGQTNMCSQQVVNMRRYWPEELRPNTLGCHISLLDLSFPTQLEDLDAFWEYARRVHSLLHYHLTETKRALKLQQMSRSLSLIIFFNAVLAKLGLPSGNDNHYTVTNMGNLSKTFSGSGSEVEVTRLLRTVSCHFMPTLCQHTLQTFRGRLCYSLDYYTQKLTRETAHQYARGIMHLLTKAIHTPN